jgi:hypothetical protein
LANGRTNPSRATQTRKVTKNFGYFIKFFLRLLCSFGLQLERIFKKYEFRIRVLKQPAFIVQRPLTIIA